MEKHIENIANFAKKHNLEYNLKGEVGFGRECVGILHDGNYIDFNPTSFNVSKDLSYLHNPIFDEIAPENAYHKHDCLCVLGTSDSSIIELSEWITKLEELNVTVETYSTGAIGMQAFITGATGKTLVIPK